MKKKLTVLLIAFLTLLFATEVFAAIPSISSSRYIKTFGLSTGNNTPVFTSARLDQRGTSYPFKAYNATIYASDEIFVFAMNNTYALVSYPTSTGRKQGYVKTNWLTANNYSQNPLRSRDRITTYVRPGGAPYGAIFNGDIVWTVARSGNNYTQVVYPAGNLYKMAWITNSDYNNYVATPTLAQGAVAGLNALQRYIYPVEGNYTLTTLFYYYGEEHSLGYRHSVWWHNTGNADGIFNAMDIACPNGTPVKAVAGGTVAYDFNGFPLVINHGNEKSLYAHLSQTLVKPGTKVVAGQVIGKVGSGHLHLEFYNQSPWEYFRDKVPFKYCKTTEKAYNERCLPVHKNRFGNAVNWIKTNTKGFTEP